MPMFEYYPSHWTMSWQFLRLVSEAHFGGGDFHEAHDAVRNIPAGDEEAWHREWYRLGEEVEKRADAELALGHRLTARACYLRSSNYFRVSEFFLLGDSRKIPTYKRCIANFEKAASLFDTPFERVEIPYENTGLPGWFVPASDRSGPVCILLGGADTIAEELYFLGGQEVLARGIHLLLVDGPGQGASLRLRNLYARPDYEVAVSAMIDWLITRPEVDPERVGFIGRSAGGYYGPRTAAFDDRIKAVVVWGACYDWLADVYDFYPPIQRQFQFLMGASDDKSCREILKDFTLEGILDKVRCPVLVSHGEQDRIVRVESAYRTYEELTVADKELKIWTPDTLGENHCQTDNISNAVRFKIDWLADRL
ncbi:MAG: prolyl oligopeptidase family serine peptidase [bacterium]|nr:prolyl oligopeptidase family serine peptidase [bacterium]